MDITSNPEMDPPLMKSLITAKKNLIFKAMAQHPNVGQYTSANSE
jgi:phage gp16-like protein